MSDSPQPARPIEVATRILRESPEGVHLTDLHRMITAEIGPLPISQTSGLLGSLASRDLVMRNTSTGAWHWRNGRTPAEIPVQLRRPGRGGPRPGAGRPKKRPELQLVADPEFPNAPLPEAPLEELASTEAILTEVGEKIGVIRGIIDAKDATIVELRSALEDAGSETRLLRQRLGELTQQLERAQNDNVEISRLTLTKVTQLAHDLIRQGGGNPHPRPNKRDPVA